MLSVKQPEETFLELSGGRSTFIAIMLTRPGHQRWSLAGSYIVRPCSVLCFVFLAGENSTYLFWSWWFGCCGLVLLGALCHFQSRLMASMLMFGCLIDTWHWSVTPTAWLFVNIDSLRQQPDERSLVACCWCRPSLGHCFSGGLICRSRKVGVVSLNGASFPPPYLFLVPEFQEFLEERGIVRCSSSWRGEHFSSGCSERIHWLQPGSGETHAN